MNDKKKGRPIGAGMKPREINENETIQQAETEELVSTESGQEETAVEPVLEASEQIETSHTLEPQSEEENIVASQAELSPILGISNLEEMLSQSQEEAAEKESQATNLFPPKIVQELESINKRMEAGERIEIVGSIPQDLAKGFLKQIQTAITPPVGPRLDGTYGMVVTIPEGMIEPIRGQAESDRVTPEEWVSTRLGEYLEDWWQPAKSR